MTRPVAALCLLLATLFPRLCLADYDVVEVSFPRTESLKRVGQAIKLALIDREWTLGAETETSIQATLNRPGEQAWVKVRITFRATGASIAYMDSSERDDARLAYRYKAWVNNVAKDIPTSLQRVKILLD